MKNKKNVQKKKKKKTIISRLERDQPTALICIRLLSFGIYLVWNKRANSGRLSRECWCCRTSPTDSCLKRPVMQWSMLPRWSANIFLLNCPFKIFAAHFAHSSFEVWRAENVLARGLTMAKGYGRAGKPGCVLRVCCTATIQLATFLARRYQKSTGGASSSRHCLIRYTLNSYNKHARFHANGKRNEWPFGWMMMPDYQINVFFLPFRRMACDDKVCGAMCVRRKGWA